MHSQKGSPTTTAVCSRTGTSRGALLSASRGTWAIIRGQNGGGRVSGECQEKAVSPNLEEEGDKPIQLHVTFSALGGADPPFYWLRTYSSFPFAVAVAIGQRRNEEKRGKEFKNPKQTGREGKKLGDLDVRAGKR